MEVTLARPPFTFRPPVRLVTVALGVVLLLDLAGAYQVGVRAKRPPTFHRGGAFVSASGRTATLQDGPFGATGGDVPPTTIPTSVAPLAPTTQGTKATTPARKAPAPSTSSSTAAAAPPRAAAGDAGLPALGTYTWGVSGTEAATGFGSRAFPSTMTMAAHRGTDDQREVVLDITYSSDHSEREILGYRPDGVFFDTEAGQVRFGPSAQTNEGTYKPPMLQVPLDPKPGAQIKGASTAVGSDGSTERVEDWTVTVGGQETIDVAGRPTPTWKVTIDRQSRPGGPQKVTRSRTYWYDPARHLWVRYTEKMHGEQSYGGFTFTYDDNLTANLTGFSAA